jgi:hypothetical protein
MVKRNCSRDEKVDTPSLFAVDCHIFKTRHAITMPAPLLVEGIAYWLCRQILMRPIVQCASY